MASPKGVVRIDEVTPGAATGTVCGVRRGDGSVYFFDFDTTKAEVKSQSVRLKLGKETYWIAATDEGLELKFQREGKKRYRMQLKQSSIRCWPRARSGSRSRRATSRCPWPKASPCATSPSKRGAAKAPCVGTSSESTPSSVSPGRWSSCGWCCRSRTFHTPGADSSNRLSRRPSHCDKRRGNIAHGCVAVRSVHPPETCRAVSGSHVASSGQTTSTVTISTMIRNIGRAVLAM